MKRIILLSITLFIFVVGLSCASAAEVSTGDMDVHHGLDPWGPNGPSLGLNNHGFGPIGNDIDSWGIDGHWHGGGQNNNNRVLV